MSVLFLQRLGRRRGVAVLLLSMFLAGCAEPPVDEPAATAASSGRADVTRDDPGTLPGEQQGKLPGERDEAVDGPAMPPVGGVNSPPPSQPRELAIDLRQMEAGGFAVRVPHGQVEFEQGAEPHSVPGPIAAFKGPDGVWRGLGYLETYPLLLSFEATVTEGDEADADVLWRAELAYRFEDDARYEVTLTARDGVVLIEEESALGPRNLYVFDFFYRWQPAAAVVSDFAGDDHAFLYMPCYYDKPEVTIHATVEDASAAPGAVAVIGPEPSQRDVAGFWMRDIDAWQGAASMSAQLWQRRQLPGDPASRHFIGPESKSDSTPNPATAQMIGDSLYEGHITFEMALGQGTRKMAFTVVERPEQRDELAEPFKRMIQNHR